MRADQVIIAPVLSEKSNLEREGETKKYTFVVHMDANKPMIMQAVKELFKVTPVKCNTMIVKGKPKNSRSRRTNRIGHTSDWKKAVVTLARGESIQAIEGV